MISRVSNANTQAALPPKQAAQKPVQKSLPRAADTVRISNAKLALQDAQETAVQTSREAAAGDTQARNLQAREAANKASRK
jgi:hypothetical protein